MVRSPGIHLRTLLDLSSFGRGGRVPCFGCVGLIKRPQGKVDLEVTEKVSLYRRTLFLGNNIFRLSWTQGNGNLSFLGSFSVQLTVTEVQLRAIGKFLPKLVEFRPSFIVKPEADIKIDLLELLLNRLL